MKRVYLLVLVFAFFSVMPSYSVKLITNNETNRIVPSRSSVPEIEEFTDEAYYNQNQNQNYNNYNQNGIPGYQGNRFEYYYRPILGQNIRTELIGTTWHYPDYYYARPQNNEPPRREEHNINAGDNKDIISKPYIREAADYYFIDTNVNPDQRFPIGIQ